MFVAGRGARGTGCRAALERLAEATGALLATSAVAKGLFNGNPWSLDISGGFSSPLAAELIRGADLIIGWGCALNMWTMRHGHLIGDGATVVQVDDDPQAIGTHRAGALGVVGDVRETAIAAVAHVAGRRPGYRSDDLKARLAAEVRWRDVPYSDDGTTERIDPRTLTIALDDLLPAARVVSVDSGNFMGYPSMYLSVPDEFGFCFTQAFQSIGLGLATAIGAALAQPHRLPVAAVGDGGGLMGVAELDTVVRLGLPMVVVVYNDDAYGAEVHHFGPHGFRLDTVEFPSTDIAAIAEPFARPEDPDRIDEIVQRLQPNGQPQLAAIDEVRDREEDTDKILSATGLVKALTAGLAVLLVLASIALVANTIRLSIFARRREVEVMKLVGATNWFIRWPFVIEGVIVGFFGGLLAVLLLTIAKETFVDPLSERFALLAAPDTIDFPLLVVLLLVACMAVSAIGSGITLRRFLRV